jgi:hypothetical protein
MQPWKLGGEQAIGVIWIVFSNMEDAILGCLPLLIAVRFPREVGGPGGQCSWGGEG